MNDDCCSRRPSLVLGITGGLGTGKSTGTGMLRAKTDAVLDADVMVHQFLQPGTCVYDRVVDRFGSQVLKGDGTIDRPKLGKIVFGDADARGDLERIVHPAVTASIKQKLHEFACGGYDVTVLDVPLLYEAGVHELCDEVWVVWCQPRQQIVRVTCRSGLDVRQAKDRMKAQMPLEEKVKRADLVLDNSGSLSDLQDEVDRQWSRLQKKVKCCLDGG